MGMVRESEDMQREINEILINAGCSKLISTQINASTELSVCARPLCYDVMLSGKAILSLNCPENAVIVYNVMRADFKGDIYHGK